MQCIVLKQPVAQVNNRAIEEGLLVIQAQGNVLRLVPPLIIEKEHVDEMIPKLTHALPCLLYTSKRIWRHWDAEQKKHQGQRQS